DSDPGQTFGIDLGLCHRLFNSRLDPVHPRIGPFTAARFATLLRDRLELVVVQDDQHFGATEVKTCPDTPGLIAHRFSFATGERTGGSHGPYAAAGTAALAQHKIERRQ